jgi:cellulose synthase operon protein C
LAKENPDAARLAMEISRVQEAVGQWKELSEDLETAAKTHGENPDLLARLAEVYFRQGRYDDAEKLVEKVLKLEGQHPLAHLVLADVAAETGRLDEALENYVWFVRYYNRQQPADAETLELVAKGSLQYARWKGSSQILKFVVNTLCPDMLKDDELAWQAHFIAGDLLLEKYNRAQALPELNRALAINPRAVDVLVSLGNAAHQKHDLEEAADFADRALKINPQHVAALWLKADVLISEGRLFEAKKRLEAALDVNPLEQRTLARTAAVHILKNGPPPEEELNKLLSQLEKIDEYQNDNADELTKLIVELAKRNPRPGYFLSTVAETLESRRKYDLAELFYRQAIQSMPELSTPKTSLGMLYMRVGKTEEASKLLDEAFDADPFHVRVSNMRKVLKLLDGYETIATDHFVIRVDSEFDRVLGRYMADYLESIYPELTKQFGYEPPQRTHFEIYNQAKGLSAHEWFSARMVGLPWIQTIGASTGVIVALASPTAAEEPFNWARVLKHEFVHVITLQQTKFNIPHWFTEALAVTAEGGARPEVWNHLLLARVPKGEIRSLDELNDGFIRPKSPADWQFAYCQSRLYAQYIIETYGEETIPKMLDAYRRNISTKDAIPKVFGVDVETFEKGYREFLNKLVSEIQGGVPEEELTLAELVKAYASKPDDAKTLGKYAAALLAVRQWPEAKEIALKAVAIDKTQPNAALALATLELRDKNTQRAIEYLEAAVTDPPNGEVLEILARLKVLEEKHLEARDLYRKGRKAFPHASTWLKGLAAVALRMDDEPALKEALKELAEREIDNAVYPKKLAQMDCRILP